MARIAIVQHGDMRAAQLMVEQGVAESYFGTYDSVASEAVKSFAAHLSIEVVSRQIDTAYRKLLEPVSLGQASHGQMEMRG